jgi:glycosyltransferase involved in cell wall biosynthesis
VTEFTGPVALLDPGNFSPQYTANLCASLAGLGVDVTLITSPPQFGGMIAPQSYRVETCFFRHATGQEALRSTISSHTRARMLLKACAYPFGLARARRLLRSAKQPGILHYQWAHIPLLDARLVSGLRTAGWRVVATAHDMVAPPPFSSLRQRQAVRFYASVDAVVVHTARLAEQAQAALSIAPSKLNVIARGDLGILRGPQLTRDEARTRLGISGPGPVLLFFGMIKPNKGLDHLLHAIPEVLRSNPDVQLVIAGEPVEKFDRYAAIIGQLGIGHAVLTRLGYVRDEDVGPYVQAADLVVLPHTQVSLSGVAWVALGFGRPIVGTHVGGLPDLVGEGVNGFLVPPGSSEALSQAIIRALRDPEHLASMGVRGRKRFEAGHSWTRTANETLQLYRRLLPIGIPARERSG